MRAPGAFVWALLFSTVAIIPTSKIKAHTECGGLLTDPSNRFFNYAGPKTSCVWTIKMKPTQKIHLIFPYLNLTCGSEKVEVLDGSLPSQSLGILCKGMSLIYVSSSNIMTVKYSRNSTHPPSFFGVQYYGDSPVTRPAPVSTIHTECGGLITDSLGKIVTSFWSQTLCIWTIQMKPMQTVVLSISLLSFKCENEQLEIIDGLLGPNSFGKVCEGMYLVFRSSSNNMTIKYSRRPKQQPSFFELFYRGDPQDTLPVPIFPRP